MRTLLPMPGLLRPVLFVAAAALAFPVAAQTPPTQGWPANRPPAPAQSPPTAAAPAPALPATPPAPGPSANAPSANAPSANAPVPLPTWFHEIDTEKKGEVS